MTQGPDLADALSARLGGDALLTEPGDVAPYLSDPINGRVGAALAVLRPRTTAEVAAAVRFCAERGVGVTPRGGGTGFSGGAAPAADRPNLVLSLERLRAIRAIDVVNETITVEAGCPLASVEAAAAAEGLSLPIRHGGAGGAQIGGTLATNAGGYNVVRHGMARAHVLGVEAVLPNGRVWDGLRGLRKDNSGYDLKQLLIGAEGTLGVITAAVLRLQPAPHATATALIAFAAPEAALDAFVALRRGCADLLAAFELFPEAALALHLAQTPGAAAPFAGPAPWMALLELEAPQVLAAGAGDLSDALAGLLTPLLQSGTARDAVIAQSGAQRAALWDLREGLAIAQARDRRVLKSDTAVPVSQTIAFIHAAARAVHAVLPGATPLPFGHLGDGNIHFNVLAPVGVTADAFGRHVPALRAAIHETSLALGGSISAEHGIGDVKVQALRGARSEVELGLMRAIKRAVDPDGIMNPGKLF